MKKGHILLHKKKIYYEIINEEAVKRERPFIVFLHEGLGSVSQWRQFPEKLCIECGLPGIVYDRYGYGQSEALQENRPIDFLQQEAKYALRELIEYFSPNKKVLLFGHSDGATISLLAAAYFSEKISGMILMAPHIWIEEISIQGILDAQADYNSGWLKQSLQKHHGNTIEKTATSWFELWLSKEGRQWSMKHLLEKINTPLLFIQGTLDNFGSKKQWEQIESKVQSPKSCLFIPSCGHHPHLEKPKIVLQASSSFISKIIS